MFYERLKLQIKIFKGDRTLSNGFIFIVGFVGIILGISLFNNSSIFFGRVVDIVFYASVMFCIMSFAFLIKARWLNINDTIEGASHQQNIYQKISIIVLLMLLGLIQIEIITMILINGFVNNNIGLVVDIIARYYCFNVLIPMITMFFITSILAMMENYRLGGILLVLVFVFSSPLMGIFEYRFPLFIPIDRIVYYIKMPFSYFSQDTGQSIDYLYGFQNEIYKLSSFLFWSLLFLGFLYKKIVFKNRMFLMLLLLFLTITFSTIYIPQSTSRNDNYNFGSYIDYNYYGIADYKGAYKEAKDYNYYISDYDLDINIDYRLNVEGKLIIQSVEPIKKCELTLYHGYKVEALDGENIESYNQDKDIITINFINPSINEAVYITYSGYNQNLYSNYQATLLPGYFPWYPMSGVKQIYITDGTSSIGNQGYNPYNRIPEASFDVKVNNCNYQLITNLKQEGNHHYQGKSDSFTLIGGNTSISEDGQYLNSLPLYNVFYKDINLTREESYNSIKDSIKKIFDININFSEKKVISISTGLAKKNQYSGFSEFDNYIIVPFGGVMYDKDILEYYTFKNISINPSIKDAIILNGINYETKDEFINMVVESINHDMIYYDNNKNNEKYKELVQIKQEISDVLKNDELDSYLKDIGKKLFGEE